jgi:hypothetical protein
VDYRSRPDFRKAGGTLPDAMMPIIMAIGVDTGVWPCSYRKYCRRDIPSTAASRFWV